MPVGTLRKIPMTTVHLLIRGKVQGVFFRASAREQAESIGLTGWIRNTGDGSVEAVVTGHVEGVNEFIRWCRTGPPKAEVKDLQVTSKEPESFDSFRVLR